MTTHLTWMTAPHARVLLRPGGNAQAMLTWRVNVAPAHHVRPRTSCTSPRPMSTPTCGRPGKAAP